MIAKVSDPMEILDTIAAVSTALAESAISMVRISGTEAITIADRLFSKSVINQKSHTMQYGFIKDSRTGEVVDEVLLSVFLAPHKISSKLTATEASLSHSGSLR
jgi:tRNA U34 5-carboxymethylaminomethyl modifying GTPase MnmE/TrmE